MLGLYFRYGIFLRVGLLSVVFIILIVFRRKITEFLLKIRIPTLFLYLLVSIPLIILEEQVNCQASWCGKAWIPPTLPFLIIELLVLYGIYRWRHLKRIRGLLIGYAIFGMFWEFFIGGARGASLPLPFMFFILVWVGISYVFVAMTPLLFLRPKE